MASSSSRKSSKYDVFPSFSGEDVRKSFLSHLLRVLDRKLINTFIDHGIERSRPIAPELLLAIRESKISIVVFSKNYASSTWCLNELVEIHKCCEELGQMVIPVFYNVDPSDVRKQTGEFGKAFEETCKGKTEDMKQGWIQVLTEVANMAGEDSRNWIDEANMIEKIATDVLNKIIIPSNDFGDFVGIEAHIKTLNSMLCLGSEEARMVGIVGPSGIGKSTIGRALFSQLSSHFHHCAFMVYKRTDKVDYGMKLYWEEQFLSEILVLGQKDIKLCELGAVKQRLNKKKVLIILDDVDNLELLKTLVGDIGWFGLGSRVIVISQDRALLKSHKIDHIYEVEFPSEYLALQMFSRSAFGQNSPPHGFMELAVEVTELAGNLPLGLNVLGSSLSGKDKEDWLEMLPRLRNDLNGKIEKTLRISYDGLGRKDQAIFLHIACLFNGEKVDNIKNLLGDDVNIGIKMLIAKSIIRIIPSSNIVQIHNLLQKLGKEIVRVESANDLGKRRFLMDVEDIREVFDVSSGTKNVLGIYLNTSEMSEPLSIDDEKSFEGFRNLRFLKFYRDKWFGNRDVNIHLPQGLLSFPRKLRLLHWDKYPLKCMPCNFRVECLVELTMINSKLEKLWEGDQPLKSLKKMNLALSKDLKEIPNLSDAKDLEKLDLSGCTSLVSLPSSVKNLNKLRKLWMSGCLKLEVLPNDVNLKSLEYLNLNECSVLKSFPRISKNLKRLFLDDTEIEGEEDCSWIENICGLTKLCWDGYPMKCMPSKFCPENLVELIMRGTKIGKLWERVQSLGSLVTMDLSRSENLKEFPELSKATNLESLFLNNCKSLVMVPSSIENLNKLIQLDMRECTSLQVLPTNINLVSLNYLNLSGCSLLTSFPQLSTSIAYLSLDETAIEEVPSWIETISELTSLTMCACKTLKNISANVFKLKHLKDIDFSDCEGVTTFNDANVVTNVGRITYDLMTHIKFHNCFNLDQEARELILQSDFEYTVLPGQEVPKYFTHRESGSSLIFPLSQSSFVEEFVELLACVMLEPPAPSLDLEDCPMVSPFSLLEIKVCWYIKGENRVHEVHVNMNSYKMDHLVMFHFGFPLTEVNDLDDKNVGFEFSCQALDVVFESSPCSCSRYGFHLETCRFSFKKIKGCGISYLDGSGTSSKTTYKYNQQSEHTTRRNMRPVIKKAVSIDDLDYYASKFWEK